MIGSLLLLALVAQPVGYAVTISTPSDHIATIDARFPTDGKATVDLMMPIWSPGFYKVEDYATRIVSLTARSAAGAALPIQHPAENRWRVETGGAPSIRSSRSSTFAGFVTASRKSARSRDSTRRGRPPT